MRANDVKPTAKAIKFTHGLKNHELTINSIAPKKPMKPICMIAPIAMKKAAMKNNNAKINAPDVVVGQDVMENSWNGGGLRTKNVSFVEFPIFPNTSMQETCQANVPLSGNVKVN